MQGESSVSNSSFDALILTREGVDWVDEGNNKHLTNQQCSCTYYSSCCIPVTGGKGTLSRDDTAPSLDCVTS